ncbi:MAG TPA: phage major capsid protein, partial [Pseudonocardiaceae bacterium]|nr:phage major capsid protein [Pseudonocardiaceae bacterium]
MRSEQRAMGITDSAGGYAALPYNLDPSIILTNSGTINPLRTVARIVTTTTDTWRGVTSAGSTASWDDEAEEVSDDSPTLASPSIGIHRLQAFVPFSREIEQDWAGPSLAQELAMVLTEAADRLMSTGYTVGSGTGEPKGVITAVSAVSGSVVAPATAETFASADVYSVIEALPARWRPRAQ